MESCRTSKEILTEWCKKHMSTHTDWVGTRVETKFECGSIQEFVDRLYVYLDSNHWRC